jgi:hypothetical protein
VPTYFADYRSFKRSWIAMNDAMMAQLVAQRIAAATLRNLVHTNDQLLPELFPGIPDLARLRRTPADAADLIESGERYFAFAAIPFVVSVFHQYISAVIRWRRRGRDDQTWIVPLEDVPSALDDLSVRLPDRELAMFDIVRRLRNRLVHNGGTAGDSMKAFNALDPGPKTEWLRLAGSIPTWGRSRDLLQLTWIEIKVALAVSKRLADTVRDQLEVVVDREEWLEIIAADFRETHSRAAAREAKTMVGFARINYSSCALTITEAHDLLGR